MTRRAFSRWCIDVPNKEVCQAARAFLTEKMDQVLTEASSAPAAAITANVPVKDAEVTMDERKAKVAACYAAIEKTRAETEVLKMANFERKMEIYKKYFGTDERDVARLKSDFAFVTTPAHHYPTFGQQQQVLLPAPTPVAAPQLLLSSPASDSSAAAAIVTDSPAPVFSRARDISLSSWALETGKGHLGKPQLRKLGIRAAVLYRARHGGAEPLKHDQYVDGAMRSVNSYTEDDKELLEEAYRTM
jgi:hypothetical protein